MTVNGVTVGQGNGTGINNLSVGLESLGKNTEGTQNTSVGAYAMHENTSGNGNTVLGNSAFYRNTEGSDNTAIGNNALPFNTTGTLNTAVGANTLKANVSGGDNTALGNNALSVNEGSRNTALGNNALTNVTDANNSVAVGCSALGSFETGVDNIAIGKSSASTLTSGNNNIVIGTSAQPSSATVSNEVTIGNDDVTKTRLKGNVVCKDSTKDYSDMQVIKDSNYFVARAWNDTVDKTELLTSKSLDFTVNEGDLRFLTGGSYSMTIGGDGQVSTTGKLTVGEMTSVGSSYPDQTNVVCNTEGVLLRSTVTYYSTEEVDKKLAIKDKLIEKLSARLDELELKFKALK